MSEVVQVPVAGTERELLEGFLAKQRAIVRWKLADARDEDLLGVASPSGMTARGVLNHLTHVERWWWRDVLDGQAGLPYDWTEADPDGEFHVGHERPLAQLLTEYADECARCDEVLAASDLDRVGAGKPVTVRWVLLHMIEETARHLGHLDLLREQADGAAGYDAEQGADQDAGA